MLWAFRGYITPKLLAQGVDILIPERDSDQMQARRIDHGPRNAVDFKSDQREQYRCDRPTSAGRSPFPIGGYRAELFRDRQGPGNIQQASEALG